MHIPPPEKNRSLPQRDESAPSSPLRDAPVTGAERVRIEEKRAMWKNSHKWIWIFPVCLLILLGASALYLQITFNSIGDGFQFICTQISHIGKIKAPFSAEEIVDHDAQEVIERLKSAGFTQITTESIADLSYVDYPLNGKVKSVSFSGFAAFSAEDYFDQAEPITVFTHAIDDQIIHLSRSKKDLVDKPLEDVRKLLSEEGFENIDAVTISKDSVGLFSFLKKDGTVDHVVIGGLTDFDNASVLYSKMPVIIYYYPEVSATKAPKPTPTEAPAQEIFTRSGSMVTLHVSMDKLKKETPDKVARIFFEAGFSSIYVCGVKKGIADSFSSDGSVKCIQIGETEQFKENSEFHSDKPVLISCFSDADSEPVRLSAEDYLCNVVMDMSSGEVKKKTLDGAVHYFKTLGFTDIQEEPVAPGVTEALNANGTIKSITIGDYQQFSIGDEFRNTRPVTITYYMKPSSEIEATPAPKEKPTTESSVDLEDYVLLSTSFDVLKKGTPDQAARILAEAGFSNLSILGVKKGVTDALSVSGSIQGIAIGETEQFKADTIFKKDQPVVIRYYSEINFEPISISADRCQKTVVMEKSSDELKKTTLDGAVRYFESLGFSSIEKQPVVPGIAEPFAVNGDIKDIFIDECSKFKAGDEFWNSRSVTITYYMR